MEADTFDFETAVTFWEAQEDETSAADEAWREVVYQARQILKVVSLYDFRALALRAIDESVTDIAAFMDRLTLSLSRAAR